MNCIIAKQKKTQENYLPKANSAMTVTIGYLPEFERRAKALAKKYKSFKSDYDTFLDELEQNPYSGEPL